MSKTQLHLIKYISATEAQEFQISLAPDTKLKQVTDYLFSEWKILSQRKAYYSLSKTDPVKLDENCTIDELLAQQKPSGNKNSLTLYMSENGPKEETPQAGASPNKCCLIF